MTLVVAHRTARGFRLDSDLRVTDEDSAGPPGYTTGVLKLILVHRHVCVGFAGRPIHGAIDTIRELAVSSDVDVEAIAQHLLTAHNR